MIIKFKYFRFFVGGVIFIIASCSDDTINNKNFGKHQHANHHMNKSSFEDLVTRFESAERDEWQKPDSVIAFLGDLKNKTVIDIGAGTGYFEFRINEPSAKLIAADADERFIEYLNTRIAKEKKGNIITRKAEYEKPPVLDQEADVVFMVDVYHHIENRKEYFSLIKKGLKPNGELVIVDFKKGNFKHGPPDEMKLNAETIISEMKEVGFNLLIQDTTTLNYQYMLKFN